MSGNCVGHLRMGAVPDFDEVPAETVPAEPLLSRCPCSFWGGAWGGEGGDDRRQGNGSPGPAPRSWLKPGEGWPVLG